MIKYLFLGITWFLIYLLSYKLIRKIDIKERKVLDEKEKEHIQYMLNHDHEKSDK